MKTIFISINVPDWLSDDEILDGLADVGIVAKISSSTPLVEKTKQETETESKTNEQ